MSDESIILSPETARQVAQEFLARRIRSQSDSKGLRERGENHTRHVQGRPPVGAPETLQNAPAVPLLYGWEEQFVPAVIDRDPWFDVKSAKSNDETRRAQAVVFEKLLEHWWEQDSIRTRVVEVALRSSIRRGIGVAQVDFDSIAIKPRVTLVPVRDFDIDLEGRHPEVRFVRWMSSTASMPIDAARKLWPGYDFVADALLPTTTTGETIREGWFNAPDANTDGTAGNQTVTVHCVYVRADDPYTEERAAKVKKRRKEKQKPEGTLFAAGENRCLYFAHVRGTNPRDANQNATFSLVGDAGWDLLPKMYEFPFSILRLTTDDESYWPRSMFDPVRGAVEAADWAARYENDSAKFSVRRVLLVARALLGKKKAEEIFKSDDTGLKVHMVDSPEAAKSGVNLLNFGDKNTVAADNAASNIARFEMVSNKAALQPQAKSHQAAQGAKLQADVSAAVAGHPSELVTAFATDISQKMLQVARPNMTDVQVAAIVGDDLMHWVEEPVLVDGEIDQVDPVTGETVKVPGKVPAFDENGVKKVNRYSPVWTNDPSPLLVLEETALSIEPFSMRRMDRETEVTLLTQMKQQLLADQTYFAQMGFFHDPNEVAVAIYAINQRMAELLGMSDYGTMVPNKLYQFAPPAQPGGGGTGGTPNALGAEAQAAEGGAAANPAGS